MNYAEAEEYINQIPRFSKVKSEENVDEILALFGHPEKKFAYIHVAGTNGKGSVCAFMTSVLKKPDFVQELLFPPIWWKYVNAFL